LRDPFLKGLYEKYYGNKTKKGKMRMSISKVRVGARPDGEVSSEIKKVEEKSEVIAPKIEKKKKVIVEKKVTEKKVITSKKERQVRFKTRPNGVLRLSDKHMQKFGFKCKQELEIINSKPGEIIIKVKS